MPLTRCDECGHDRFAVELRRVTARLGDASVSMRVPAQACLRCGRAHVELQVEVERPPPRPADPEEAPDDLEQGGDRRPAERPDGAE